MSYIKQRQCTVYCTIYIQVLHTSHILLLGRPLFTQLKPQTIHLAWANRAAQAALRVKAQVAQFHTNLPHQRLLRDNTTLPSPPGVARSQPSGAAAHFSNLLEEWTILLFFGGGGFQRNIRCEIFLVVRPLTHAELTGTLSRALKGPTCPQQVDCGEKKKVQEEFYRVFLPSDYMTEP